MAPFLVLVTVTLTFRAVGALGVDFVDDWPASLAVGLSAMFLLTASAHFVPASRRAGLIAMVPPRLPNPAMLVTATGILEILGAVGLLIPTELVPGVRAASAIGLALMIIAMFPANVYAAASRRHPAAPHTPLALRTILQIVFVASSVIVAVTS